MDIGSKIRKIRLQEQMTLQQLATCCNCSKSLLSKIENSDANPSIATLAKITSALGVKMSVLLDDSNTQTSVFTPASSIQDSSFNKAPEGYEFAALSANYLDNGMTPLLVRARAGEVIEHEMTHANEEFIMVLSGEILFHVGKEKYIMKERDCLYFNSAEKHGMVPLTETAEYLDIVL